MKMVINPFLVSGMTMEEVSAAGQVKPMPPRPVPEAVTGYDKKIKKFSKIS
ncbi:hypothetical protein AALH30_16820 [Blautia pseudococcoides]|uniref:hypothetical protein n=1 Tax=Blautia pseudococcoides TaxID=1796616 RepID=UPI001FABD624|nr:hypothetical protein [Blautia pseudococcoides]